MTRDTVRIVREEILSDHYLPLKNVTYAQRRQDGELQVQSREVYDCADGAAVLLYNRAHRSVVLTRQFRLGARLAGHDGYLLEAAAGMLDGADPAERAKAEAREETGYAIEHVQPALQLYVSPGSTTERIHLFVAEYDRARRCDDGGGNAGEGEDIEVVELDFDDALAMVETGDIVDAKTVLLLMYLERKVLGRHGEAS
ncbi:NUDIX domain-containing protein [Telluria mixta]|uniref:GDP-mannose pyrophosphatase n=1 Tax=Telluria mixta TaxID=34071 RepID=A0ABT2C6W8_9BURK|nr:NUDIX domain-containing protein [Telluria mixta]MCS0633123.1 NUDIX domain-containing protein [Telluria mixta]WEM96065.1 NUDIX domain-containing protein [Telluria mixta]